MSNRYRGLLSWFSTLTCSFSHASPLQLWYSLWEPRGILHWPVLFAYLYRSVTRGWVKYFDLLQASQSLFFFFFLSKAKIGFSHCRATPFPLPVISLELPLPWRTPERTCLPLPGARRGEGVEEKTLLPLTGKRPGAFEAVGFSFPFSRYAKLCQDYGTLWNAFFPRAGSELVVPGSCEYRGIRLAYFSGLSTLCTS